MPSTTQRQEWMDLLRGLAVTLVILYHAANTVSNVGQEPPAFVLAVNDALAPYRMPMLVFLSGMLLHKSLRKTPGQYLWGKFAGIGWPYLLWLIPQAIIYPPEDWFSFVRGGTYLWFLVFILVYYVIGLLTSRVPPLLVAAVAMALAVASPDGSKYKERLFFLLVFFMLGHWFATHPRVQDRVFSSNLMLALSAIMVVAYQALRPGAGYGPASTLATIGGIILLARFARAVSGVRWLRPFKTAGRDSLIVYIIHVVGMQIAELFFRPESSLPGGVLYAIFLAAGLGAVALALFVVQQVPVARYLFTLSPKRRSASPAPPTP